MLVDKSADTAKNFKAVLLALLIPDEPCLDRKNKLILSQLPVVLRRLLFPRFMKHKKSWHRYKHAMLRYAGTGAVAGEFMALLMTISVLQGATKGAVRGAGAGLLYSGYRSDICYRNLLNMVMIDCSTFMFSYSNYHHLEKPQVSHKASRKSFHCSH